MELPTRHIASLEQLIRLDGLLREDFPAVKRVIFLGPPSEIWEHYGRQYFLVAHPESGEWYQFEEGIYNAGGFASIRDGLIGVILPRWGSLYDVVETAVHEAAHVETKSETCDVPNKVAAERAHGYVEYLKTF